MVKLKTVAETARELGVCETHVYRMLWAKRWPGYRFGRKGWRIDLDEILAVSRRDVTGKTKRARNGNKELAP